MAEVAGSSGVVAIVDDDGRVLESMANLVESAGYEARVFLSAASFLEHRALHEVACLLCDISMPGTDGWELRSIVRRRFPALPVIMMTGRADLPLAGASVAAEACRPLILGKPFEGPLLLGALLALIGKP